MSYNATIKSGKEIFIPSWDVGVALENLTKAGKYLGSENIINIAELNLASTIVAIMDAKEPAIVAQLIKHFVCQVRIDGKKITEDTIDSMFESNLGEIAELFTHVIHAQYSSFFALGLAKEPSPDK
jgi:hypothetical protein